MVFEKLKEVSERNLKLVPQSAVKCAFYEIEL